MRETKFLNVTFTIFDMDIQLNYKHKKRFYTLHKECSTKQIKKLTKYYALSNGTKTSQKFT